MNYIQSVLKDGRRAQRGGVLSGVLILVAFLAIISGALMTELSANFLLSRTLMNRAANEATVSSAVELALDRLQTQPPVSGCPTFNPITLNGSTAVVSYVSCAPVVDRKAPPFTTIATASPFNVDGSHDKIAAIGQDLYLVGDSSGNIYQFKYGSSTPNWTGLLAGGVTGPPLSMIDSTTPPGDVTSLVPISVPAQQQPSSSCPSNYCVARLTQDVGRSPESTCYMPATAAVTSRPAAGANMSNTTYFGDHNGTVFAYSTSESDSCALLDFRTGVPGLPVVAGPVVFPGPTGGSSTIDEIYVVQSDGSSSRLVRYTLTSRNGDSDLQLAATLTLPDANATGLAIDQGGLPIKMAITFAGGQVMLIQLQSNFGWSVLASLTIASAIADAPYWCQCSSPGDMIGVAGTNGALYLFDSTLTLRATYASGGPAITTSPSSDTVGDWFFGASDGYVYEVQWPAGQSTMTLAARFGPFGSQVGSSVQVGGCATWICIYVGTVNGSAYLVPLDARDAVMSACVSTAPPACSGANPRLWVQVEVGSLGSQRTVSVQGWSYYSP